MLTLDTQQLGWRPTDLDLGSFPSIRGMGIAQYTSDPVFIELVREHVAAGSTSPRQRPPASRSWSDLDWLRERTSLPIILKGILDPADARLAAEHAIDGIVGSNHGGRQVDGEIGALDALPGIVEAVGDRVTVLFDSGVRSGADVYKALALGARAVLPARPFIAGAAPHMYPGDCIGQADSPICTSAHGSDRLMSSG